MDKELETVDPMSTTKHQVVAVVLGAVAGYLAGRMATSGYAAVVHKYHSIRANRES